jgi:2-polyprenyl-6-methoxyphenol hydroxylase-like FAD-dependent oxidoreductase
VHFSTRIDTVELLESEARVTISGPDGSRTVGGPYLIGADGGRSTVRKALEIDFEGCTFPERFLALTTPYDFTADQDVCFRNYIADPGAWTNLFKVAGDDGSGLWHAVFPTLPGETDERVLADLLELLRWSRCNGWRDGLAATSMSVTLVPTALAGATLVLG